MLLVFSLLLTLAPAAWGAEDAKAAEPLLLDDPDWTVSDTVDEAFYGELAELCAQGDATEMRFAAASNSAASYAASDDDYRTARVLALTEGKLNTELLGARRALYDGTGMWVLQFDTPAEAKTAVETLSAAGIDAEPDRHVTVAQPQSAYADEVIKPGESCGFSAFKTLYADALAQTMDGAIFWDQPLIEARFG